MKLAARSGQRLAPPSAHIGLPPDRIIWPLLSGTINTGRVNNCKAYGDSLSDVIPELVARRLMRDLGYTR